MPSVYRRVLAEDYQGPPYPNLGPSVAKFRNKPDADPKAYGQAVRAAIRSLQRQELLRAGKYFSENRRPNCASGTAHTSGKAILKAVREQNQRRFETEARKPRLSDDQLIEAYHAAMQAKRQMEAL
jgi:hypothetical protein